MTVLWVECLRVCIRVVCARSGCTTRHFAWGFGMPLHDSPRFTHVYGKMHQRISAIFFRSSCGFQYLVEKLCGQNQTAFFFFDKKIRFATILNFVKLWPKKQKWTFWTSLPLLKERVQKPKAYLSGCSPFAIFMEDLVMPAHWTSGV